MRTRSFGPIAVRSRLKVLTGALESTQLSLLLPPRCVDSTRVSGPVATRARPPGMAT